MDANSELSVLQQSSQAPMLTPVAPILPLRATPSQLLWLAEVHAATWPCGLERYKLFHLDTPRKKESPGLRRAIAWDPFAQLLHAIPVQAGKAPESSKKPEVLMGVGRDVIVTPMPETVTPEFMTAEKAVLPAASIQGMSYRTMVVNAVLMLDPRGEGRPEDFIFNDAMLFDRNACNASVRRVIELLERTDSYRPTVLELLNKFFHYGGAIRAMARLTMFQGGPEVSRAEARTNKAKPGALSLEEQVEKENAAHSGRPAKRQRPMDKVDLKNMAEALLTCWAIGKQNYETTYRYLIDTYYLKRSILDKPTFEMFKWYAPRIIVRDDLKRIRLGHKTSTQENNAMTGQASQLTGGVIEIVDIDGWEPKVPIAVLVRGKVVPTRIKIIIARSRLTGAILGYEITLRGENAESFRRCIASIYLPKQPRATALGLGKLKGLLHGNIDGIFVDNGAGASESVVAVAVDEMKLVRVIAPPGQGEKKPGIEGFNSALTRMMAEDKIGATRDRDALSRELRRLRQKADPIPLDKFERYFLKIINHSNLYSNKEKLRWKEIKDKKYGISPAALHRYHAKYTKFGSAAKTFTVEEINDRFVPWRSLPCPNGVVTLNGVRFSSTSLETFFNELAKYPGNVKTPEILVKRLTNFDANRQLMWKKAPGVHEILEMVPEDKLRFGATGAWKALDFEVLDVAVTRKAQKDMERRKRNLVSTEEHKETVAAEQRRGNPYAGMSGFSVVEAKQAGIQQRNMEFAQAEAEAYRLQTPGVAVKADTDAVVPMPAPNSDDEFFQDCDLL